MPRTTMFGDSLAPPPKEKRWEVVEMCLSDLYEVYSDREFDINNIPPQHRDQDALDNQVDLALKQLMEAYDRWLD